MRVTAKPAPDTRVIDVGATPSAPPTAALPDSRPSRPRVLKGNAPGVPSWAPRLILAAATVVSVVGGSLFLVVDALRGPTSVPTGSPSPSVTATPLRAPG